MEYPGAVSVVAWAILALDSADRKLDSAELANCSDLGPAILDESRADNAARTAADW